MMVKIGNGWLAGSDTADIYHDVVNMLRCCGFTVQIVGKTRGGVIIEHIEIEDRRE